MTLFYCIQRCLSLVAVRCRFFPTASAVSVSMSQLLHISPSIPTGGSLQRNIPLSPELIIADKPVQARRASGAKGSPSRPASSSNLVANAQPALARVPSHPTSPSQARQRTLGAKRRPTSTSADTSLSRSFPMSVYFLSEYFILLYLGNTSKQIFWYLLKKLFQQISATAQVIPNLLAHKFKAALPSLRVTLFKAAAM